MSEFHLVGDQESAAQYEKSPLQSISSENFVSPLACTRSHLFSLLVLTFCSNLFFVINYFVLVYRQITWEIYGEDNNSILAIYVISLVLNCISQFFLLTIKHGNNSWFPWGIGIFSLTSVGLSLYNLKFLHFQYFLDGFGFNINLVLGFILKVLLVVAVIRFLINLNKSGVSPIKDSNFLCPFIILMYFIVWDLLRTIWDATIYGILSYFFSPTPPTGVVCTFIDICLVLAALVGFILVRNKKIGVIVPLILLWASSIPYVIENFAFYGHEVILTDHHVQYLTIDVESMGLGASAKGLALIASVFYGVIVRKQNN